MILHKYGAKSRIQIAHAGRKSVMESDDIVAPSAIPFSEDSPLPRELKQDEMEGIIDAFVASTKRAVRAGVDMFDVSKGGDSMNKPVVYPGYQTKYATELREKLQVPVISVGVLESAELSEFIIREEMADLVLYRKRHVTETLLG